VHLRSPIFLGNDLLLIARLVGHALFLSIGILVLIPAQAGNTIDDAYDQAVLAFNKGAYDQALKLFLEARSLGMDEPSLHYNLGSTYYKLGRYTEARAAFLKTAKDPGLAPLAYYNLGLSSLRLGETDSATDWFERVLDTSDNPRLRQLALAQLKRAPAPASPSRGSASLGINTGYDTNVLLTSDSNVLTSTQQGDLFVETFGYGSYRIGPEIRGVTFGIDGNADLIHYSKLKDYDIADFLIGGTARRAGAWTGELGAHLGYTALGGNPFTRENLFSLAAYHDFTPEVGLRLRYEYGVIDELDTRYRYLDGLRRRFDARLSVRQGGRRLSLMYEFETNDRRDLSAPLFTSYSPIRQGLRLLGETPLRGQLRLEGELRWLYSRYRDPSEISVGTFERRIDNRLSGGLRLAYSLDHSTDASLEYLYTNNVSDIGRYQYVHNLVTIGLSKYF
jgi:hypothetical protein